MVVILHGTYILLIFNILKFITYVILTKGVIIHILNVFKLTLIIIVMIMLKTFGIAPNLNLFILITIMSSKITLKIN